jgi:hypothetical protein
MVRKDEMAETDTAVDELFVSIAMCRCDQAVSLERVLNSISKMTIPVELCCEVALALDPRVLTASLIVIAGR